MNEFDIKSAFWAAGAILVLGIAGFLTHPFFVDFSFYLLKNVQIQSVEPGTAFKNRIIFSVALAFIPLLFLGLRKLAKITEWKQQIFAACAIVIGGIVFWQFKISSLNTRYEELSQGTKSVVYFFALEDLHLELYLLLGFIIGAVLAGVGLFRFRKRQG